MLLVSVTVCRRGEESDETTARARAFFAGPVQREGEGEWRHPNESRELGQTRLWR